VVVAFGRLWPLSLSVRMTVLGLAAECRGPYGHYPVRSDSNRLNDGDNCDSFLSRVVNLPSGMLKFTRKLRKNRSEDYFAAVLFCKFIEQMFLKCLANE